MVRPIRTPVLSRLTGFYKAPMRDVRVAYVASLASLPWLTLTGPSPLKSSQHPKMLKDIWCLGQKLKNDVFAGMRK